VAVVRTSKATTRYKINLLLFIPSSSWLHKRIHI
jgi:hypothetical protein